MNCSLYKTKYIDKTKKSFSNHLNNDRPDVSDPNAIPKCCILPKMELFSIPTWVHINRDYCRKKQTSRKKAIMLARTRKLLD